jgi:hypothetical protein
MPSFSHGLVCERLSARWTNSETMVWPPPQPSLAVQVATSMTFSQHPGDHWWQQREEHTAALRAEQERVAAYYDEMARQREERENAEAQERARRVATHSRD